MQSTTNCMKKEVKVEKIILSFISAIMKILFDTNQRYRLRVNYNNFFFSFFAYARSIPTEDVICKASLHKLPAYYNEKGIAYK